MKYRFILEHAARCRVSSMCRAYGCREVVSTIGRILSRARVIKPVPRCSLISARFIGCLVRTTVQQKPGGP